MVAVAAGQSGFLISIDTAHPGSGQGHFHVAQSQNPISS